MLTPFNLQVSEYDRNVISIAVQAYVQQLAPKPACSLLLL